MVKPILCILSAAVLFTGCTTTRESTPVVLPPVNETVTGTSNPGQVIWHDLATSDIEAAKSFYGELLGWTFDELSDTGRRYTTVSNGDAIIGGMFQFISPERKNATGEWLVNLSSADPAADAAAMEAAGGKVLEPARDVPDRGTGAFVADPQKAVMILTRSSSGDPGDSEVPVGGWLWNELWTHDAPAALELYTSIFGYESEQLEGLDGRNYYLLKKNGTPVGGILGIRNEEIRPHWVPFVRVADLQVSLVIAMELGATILIEPSQEIRDGTVALLQAPTGEPIVLQEFEFDNQ